MNEVFSLYLWSFSTGFIKLECAKENKTISFSPLKHRKKFLSALLCPLY